MLILYVTSVKEARTTTTTTKHLPENELNKKDITFLYSFYNVRQKNIVCCKVTDSDVGKTKFTCDKPIIYDICLKLLFINHSPMITSYFFLPL